MGTNPLPWLPALRSATARPAIELGGGTCPLPYVGGANHSAAPSAAPTRTTLTVRNMGHLRLCDIRPVGGGLQPVAGTVPAMPGYCARTAGDSGPCQVSDIEVTTT